MANNDKPSHRAYVKGVTISFEDVPLDAMGDLIPVKVTNAGKEERFFSLCPECDEPTRVTQVLVCAEHSDHGPLTRDQITRQGREVNGGIVVHTTDVVKEARQSDLPPNELVLHAYHRSDVELLPSGSAYVFRATGGKGYGVLLDFIEKNPNVVLIGRVNLRKAEKIFQVTRGLNGQMILQELVWPEDLREFDAPVYTYSEKTFELASTFILQCIETYDAQDWTKETRQKLAALSGDEVVVSRTVEKPKANDEDALAEILAAAIAKKKSA